MLNKISILVLALIPIVFFSACGNKKEENNTKDKNNIELKTTQKANTTFNLKTTSGKNILVSIENDKWTFKGYENQVILLNFFATWCPPCKAEIPNLINLQNKYKDKFHIISVLLEQDKTDAFIRMFIKKYKINYEITNSAENYKLADKLGGITSIPTMFIFDNKGKMMEKYRGAVPQEMIDTDIQKGINR